MDTEQHTVLLNRINKKMKMELFILIALGPIVFVITGHYDFLENLLEFTDQYERFELDEILSVCIFYVFVFIFFLLRHWKESITATKILLQKNKKLQEALGEIEQLRGIIPICASCKKIRDDEGYWHQVESYVSNHSKAEFSHGICPECIKKLYPEFVESED